MELGTTITALVILLICITPFAILNFNTKKKEKQLLLKLNKLASNCNSIMGEHDFWNQSVIGITLNNEWICTTVNVQNKITSYRIQLSKLEKCSLIIARKPLTNNTNGKPMIRKIELLFTYQNSSTENISIEFYDAAYDSLTITNELQLAEKWNQVINKKMNSKL